MKKSRALLSILSLSSLLFAGNYSGMSCYELWYAKNAIFAKKGYCFSSQRAINTFGPRCYYPYGKLNSWEKQEVSGLRRWYHIKGCGNSHSSSSSLTGYAKVSGIRWNDTLAVRSRPTSRSLRIGDLAPDATGIRILYCKKRWCKINYHGLEGWAYAKYLRSY